MFCSIRELSCLRWVASSLGGSVEADKDTNKSLHLFSGIRISLGYTHTPMLVQNCICVLSTFPVAYEKNSQGIIGVGLQPMTFAILEWEIAR